VTSAAPAPGGTPSTAAAPDSLHVMPWWGRVSSLLAPVLLIGGWTLAASRQPAGFDSVRDTISALAALDATDRWIMTAGIAGTGICHLVTASALTPAATAGRVVLGVGGAATILVAVFPLPAGDGSSTSHGLAAATAFLALSAWPLASWRRGDDVAWGLRRPVAITAGVVLLGLVGAFGASFGPAKQVGLAERVAAGAQSLWPAAVVLSMPRRRRRSA
jgi:hypothetical membrane protein